MTEPDLCLNTVDIVNFGGEVLAKLVCLLPDDHDTDCAYQRFSPTIAWSDDD